MTKPLFTGACTALITPFLNGKVNYPMAEILLRRQIDAGITAVVLAGTTGESATLSDDEKAELFRKCKAFVGNDCLIIAGTGSNDTAYAIELTKHCCDVGADAMLVVTPYYNKATQAGLVKSFTAIADASTKPIILYNVPSRTGCSLEPATCSILADHEKIVGIKEASGNISKIVETAALVGDKLDIYSGNDDQIVPVLSMGGAGCISVLSNVIPRETCEITNRYFAGDITGAAKLQCKYLPLINALFSEVNPIPVKAAMNAMGFCENDIRLPLTEMEEAHRRVLIERMREVGLSV